MANNQDIIDGTASLAELAVSQGLIGRKEQQVIDGAQTPFEKAGQFVEIFSEATKKDPEKMSKFISILWEEGIDPEKLKKFEEDLKKKGADEKLVKEIGEVII